MSETAEGKNPVGRPPFEITEEVIKKAESLAAQGLTMEQIAHSLGMGESTLHDKKKEFSEFSEAIKRGQSTGIATITNKLFERAKGYSHPEEKIFCSKDGDITRTDTTKHYPPDTTAQIFYLKNRAGWADKQQIETTTPQPKLINTMEEYEKELAKIRKRADPSDSEKPEENTIS